MHSAMRGSALLLHGTFSLLAHHHVKLPLGLSPSHPAYPVAVSALAAFGFYAQLGRAFGLPFPLSLLLLPLRVLEAVLSWALAYGPR